MLVRISCTTAGSLGSYYDDSKARVTPHVQYYDLSEYIVAWRNHQIEIYKNYVGPRILQILQATHSTTVDSWEGMDAWA